MKDKLLKLINKHKIVTIIGITTLFLFVVPPIIHFIVTTDWGIGFITPDNQDTWINFYGAIIGGGITLGGVAWTIYDQNKKRKEDLSISYKPFLLCTTTQSFNKDILKEEITSYPIYDEDGFETGTDYDKTYTTNIVIPFENKGRGEAIIKDVTIDKWFDASVYPVNIRYLNSYETIINPTDFYKLSLQVDIDDSSIFNKDIYCCFEIIIKYTDFLNKNEYTRTSTLEICNLPKEDYTTIENGASEYDFGIYIK